MDKEVPFVFIVLCAWPWLGIVASVVVMVVIGLLFGEDRVFPPCTGIIAGCMVISALSLCIFLVGTFSGWW